VNPLCVQQARGAEVPQKNECFLSRIPVQYY
jgi:hypothetical protein